MANFRYKFYVWVISSFVFLAFTSSISAQKRSFSEFPFQVLWAKEVTTTSSNLRALDYVKDDATLEIQEDGYLVLVHYTGRTFEFYEAQSIDVNKITPEFICQYDLPRPDLKKVVDKIYRGQLFGRYRTTDRDDQYCHFMGYPDNPNSTIVAAGRNDKVFITWRQNSEPEEYEVVLKDIYVEDIVRFKTRENYMSLDFSQLLLEEPYIIDMRVGDCQSITFKLKFEECGHFFDSDQFENSTQFLVFGLLLEMNGNVNGAKKYYQKAREIKSPVGELIEKNYFDFMVHYRKYLSKNRK